LVSWSSSRYVLLPVLARKLACMDTVLGGKDYFLMYFNIADMAMGVGILIFFKKKLFIIINKILFKSKDLFI
jgi:hypothetical protein